MHGMGILKRIVMDEAHVALTHCDFRPDMEKLVIVMRTVPVQVVLLTATMPPSMEQHLRVVLVGLGGLSSGDDETRERVRGGRSERRG